MSLHLICFLVTSFRFNVFSRKLGAVCFSGGFSPLLVTLIWGLCLPGFFHCNAVGCNFHLYFILQVNSQVLCYFSLGPHGFPWLSQCWVFSLHLTLQGHLPTPVLDGGQVCPRSQLCPAWLFSRETQPRAPGRVLRRGHSKASVRENREKTVTWALKVS